MDSSIAETSKKNPETSRDSSMAEPAQDQSIGDPSKENPETSMQKPESPKQNPEPPKQNPEPPQQNPETSEGSSSMAESCVTLGDLLKENPESSNQKPTNSFSFEIRPAAKLKHAIEALSNVPTHGRVTFEVRENGMKIIASDESMNFVCYLYLKAGDLINFEYNQPFNKWVDIEQILNIFGVSEDGDKIQIHHVDGSNCLNFIFVMFEIADGTVSIKVEEQARTYYEHKESIATRGLKYSARFRFAHCEFLRKALSTAEGVLLFLATKPPDSNSLIVSFNHGELEELMCMYLFDDLEKINHYSFSLQIHPASKLKYAIDALRHANNSGTGIIEVGANGMKILCGDDEKPQTICICYLDFKAGSLINFKYNKHFKKLVRFEQIVQTLNGSNEGDIITIQHIDGSDKLSFMIGKLPCEDVPVLAANIAREVFPDMNQKLAFFIDWEHMRKIIQQPVLFEMLGGTVSIKVGEQLLTRFKYRENNANSGMNPYVRFQFVHHEFLEKALLVAEEVLLCLGVHPRGSPDILRLRFNLGELGDLVYVEEA